MTPLELANLRKFATKENDELLLKLLDHIDELKGTLVQEKDRSIFVGDVKLTKIDSHMANRLYKADHNILIVDRRIDIPYIYNHGFVAHQRCGKSLVHCAMDYRFGISNSKGFSVLT